MTRPVALLAVLAAAFALAGCVLPGPAFYIDGEQHELEQALAGTPVKVIRRGDALILRMPSDVTFDIDRAEISPSFFPILDSMASVIAKYAQTTVEVTGHADSTGTEEHNQVLSEHRATSVGTYLASKGVQRSRIDLDGEGENSPIASNETEEGRAANRRVEVTLQPTVAQVLAPLAQSAPKDQPTF